jgi:hypothetical protein
VNHYEQVFQVDHIYFLQINDVTNDVDQSRQLFIQIFNQSHFLFDLLVNLKKENNKRKSLVIL